MLGFDFISDLFAVIVFLGDSHLENRKTIDESLKEVFTHHPSVYPVDIDGYYTVLINFAPNTDREEGFALLTGYAESIRTSISRQGKELLYCISQVYQGLDMVPVAYGEVINMLTHSSDESFEIPDSAKNDELGQFFMPEQEKVLIAALCSGNEKDAFQNSRYHLCQTDKK